MQQKECYSQVQRFVATFLLSCMLLQGCTTNTALHVEPQQSTIPETSEEVAERPQVYDPPPDPRFPPPPPPPSGSSALLLTTASSQTSSRNLVHFPASFADFIQASNCVVAKPTLLNNVPKAFERAKSLPIVRPAISRKATIQDTRPTAATISPDVQVALQQEEGQCKSIVLYTPATRNSQFKTLLSQPWRTYCGKKIRFKEGHSKYWAASDDFASELPVLHQGCNNFKEALVHLNAQPEASLKYHIRVIDAANSPYPKVVFISRSVRGGLQGGMRRNYASERNWGYHVSRSSGPTLGTANNTYAFGVVKWQEKEYHTANSKSHTWPYC